MAFFLICDSFEDAGISIERFDSEEELMKECEVNEITCDQISDGKTSYESPYVIIEGEILKAKPVRIIESFELE